MAMYKQLTATAQVKTIAGKVAGIFVSSGTPTIAVYDSDKASASDPKVIDTFTAVAATGYMFPNMIATNKGIYVVIGGSGSLTFIYE